MALLYGKGKVPGCTFALSDEEGPVLVLFVEHLLGLCPPDLCIKPPDTKEKPLITATTSKELFFHRGYKTGHFVYKHELRRNTHWVD